MKASLQKDGSIILGHGRGAMVIAPFHDAHAAILRLYGQRVGAVDLSAAEPIQAGYGGHPWRDGTPDYDQTYAVPTDEIVADPDRLQFRDGVDAVGVVRDDPENYDEWDADRAGTLHVWKDPADGVTYVVDGHHRLARAIESDAPTVEARYIRAATADEARAEGKRLNVEGGTAGDVGADEVVVGEVVESDTVADEPDSAVAIAMERIASLEAAVASLTELLNLRTGIPQTISLSSGGDDDDNLADDDDAADDTADDATDTEDLANFYAELWDGLTPDEIGDAELSTVHDELSHGKFSLTWSKKAGWKVVASGGDDGESAGTVRLSVKHAPKGGVKIDGKEYRGGQFIPAAEYAKATPAEKAKIDAPAKAATDARKARGSVDTDKVRGKIKDKHGHHELTAQEKTSAKRSLNALVRHHGEMTVHRLEEIADSLHAAHDRTPEDEEGQRTQFSRRLKAVEHMLDMAKERGHEGKVAEPEKHEPKKTAFTTRHKKDRKEINSESLREIVKTAGGISLSSLEACGFDIKAMRESGLGGLFRRNGGRDVIELAQEMHNEGHIVIPGVVYHDDPNIKTGSKTFPKESPQYFIDQLEKTVKTLHADVDDALTEKMNDYYKEQHDAERNRIESGEVEAATDAGERDSDLEATEGDAWEGTGSVASQGDGTGEVETDPWDVPEPKQTASADDDSAEEERPAVNYANALTIAADSVEQLRKQDVYRVIDSMQDQDTVKGMADHILAARPELKPEVNEAVADVSAERGYTADAPVASPAIDPAHIKEARKQLAAGKIGVKGNATSEPVTSALSGLPIRRHIELANGAKVHPDELHRAVVNHDGKVELHPLESISVKDPMNDGESKEKSFGRALSAVVAYKGNDGDRVTLQSPHGYVATKTRGEWRTVASDANADDSFATWFDRENPEIESEAAKAAVPRAAAEKEGDTDSFFAPKGEQGQLYHAMTPDLKADAGSGKPPEPPVVPPIAQSPDEDNDATIQPQEKIDDKQPATSTGHDGGTSADGGASGDDGGRGDRPVGPPRIITVREQHTRQGNPALVPESIRQHLNDAQVHGASLAIDSLEKHKGFLLADGTGVGKTRQQLAVAQAFLDKGKKVLIVSPAEVIKPNWGKGSMSGSFASDSEQMGVPVKLVKGDTGITAGSVHITTYNELGKIKDHVDANTVIIFDESHFMKNRDSQRFKHGKDAIEKAGAVMFATATPADKPLHIAHLAKANVFGNAGMSETYQKLGMRLAEVHIGGGQTRKVWQIDPKVGYKEAARRMSGLFDQMTKDGLMIKRELSMDRVAVGMDRVKLSDEEHASMKSVYDKSLADTGGNKAVALMAARMHQEPFKIPSTVQMVKDELAAGRMPVVFMGRVNDITDEDDDGEESVQSEGTAKALKAALIAAGVPESHIGELHGGATKTADQKKKAMADFQSGNRKVMLATIQSGGTGINLDDTTGENPRTLIMMTPPFTANDMSQAIGRVNRLNTKSDVKVRGVLADTAIDDWNAKLLEKKFQMLGAVVGGNAERGIDAVRPNDAPEADDGNESAFDWGESLHPIEKVYYNTPFGHNELIGKFGGKRTQKNGEWTTQFPSQKHFDEYKANVSPAAKPAATPSPAPTKSPSNYFVSGNTFAHKDKIKAAGGRWDSGRGGWVIPSHAKDKISHLGGLKFTEQGGTVSLSSAIDLAGGADSSATVKAEAIRSLREMFSLSDYASVNTITDEGGAVDA